MPASLVQRFGPSALFIALSTTPESSFLAVQQLIVALEALSLFGVREMVRGYSTLLVEFTAAEFCSDAILDLVKERVASVEAEEKLVAPVETRVIDVPVCYDGPDLERVAKHAGLTTAEVIGLHTGSLCQVHFLGFAPGFPYLSGLNPRLATPRLITPRPRVSPGSVGIGGNQTGIYSVATPGGWNLIGRTSLPLFSPQAVAGEQMFLFRPGDRVRFVAVDELEQPPKLETTPTHGELGSPILKVLRNGAGITLQDAGRPGWKRYGVPEGGALDRFAMEMANLLAGNSASEPVLELGLGGQTLEVLRTTHVALTGADLDCQVINPDSQEPWRLAPWECREIVAGSQIRFGRRVSGVWAYLAVPGGFRDRLELRSVGGNARASLGRILGSGDVVYGDSETRLASMAPIARRRLVKRACPEERASTPVRVWPAPQWDWFSHDEREAFFRQDWTVSAKSDRTGYRLEGSPLTGNRPEMLSEPTLPGAIQILPSGQPVVTLPDGPTVSGYPRLGLIDPEDFRLLIQTRPGGKVRFTPRNQDSNLTG